MREAYVVLKAHSNRPVKVFKRRSAVVAWLRKRADRLALEQPILIYHLTKKSMKDWVYTAAQLLTEDA